MSAADKAVAHILRRIQRDPRLAYFFDPLTESFDLLIEAHVEKHGGDVHQVRDQVEANMKFKPWPSIDEDAVHEELVKEAKATKTTLEYLLRALDIAPDETEFEFSANGKVVGRITVAQVLARMDAVLAKIGK